MFYAYVEYRLLFFYRRYNVRKKNTEKRGKLEGENEKKRFKSVRYDQMAYADIEI